jgi:hypothetical protein
VVAGQWFGGHRRRVWLEAQLVTVPT